MFPPSLSNGPPELLDHVCSFLDRPADLLSFSLTSKQMSRIVIPKHLEFRIISCDIKRIGIWKKLVELPALASRLRTLEIINEDNSPFETIFPNSFLEVPIEWGSPENTDDEGVGDMEEMAKFEVKCVEALSSAIRCMSSLTRFKWAHYGIRPTNHDNLFISLRRGCPQLVEVEIFNTRNLDLTEDGIVNSPLWTLSGLSKFSFTSIDDRMRDEFYNAYTKNMIDMLILRCPDLQELQLAQNRDRDLHSDDIESLFACVYWPRLRKLSFQGAAFTGPPEALEGFYEGHGGLEALHIHDDDYNAEVTNLPNLRSLHMAGPGVSIYNKVDLEVARNLEHLSTPRIDDLRSMCSAMSFFLDLENLRSLVIAVSEEFMPWAAFVLARCPIEKLAIVMDSPWLTFTQSDLHEQEGKLAKLCTVLVLIPYLTHFSRFEVEHLGSSSDGSDLEDLVLKRIAAALPNLRYVEVGQDPQWFTIRRDVKGAYEGRDLTTNLKGVMVDDWGDFYIGAGDVLDLNVGL